MQYLIFYRHTLVIIISLFPSIFVHDFFALDASHTTTTIIRFFLPLNRSQFLPVCSNSSLLILITHSAVQSSFTQMNGFIRTFICPRHQLCYGTSNFYLGVLGPVSTAGCVTINYMGQKGPSASSWDVQIYHSTPETW